MRLVSCGHFCRWLDYPKFLSSLYIGTLRRCIPCTSGFESASPVRRIFSPVSLRRVAAAARHLSERLSQPDGWWWNPSVYVVTGVEGTRCLEDVVRHARREVAGPAGRGSGGLRPIFHSANLRAKSGLCRARMNGVALIASSPEDMSLVSPRNCGSFLLLFGVGFFARAVPPVG